MACALGLFFIGLMLSKLLLCLGWVELSSGGLRLGLEGVNCGAEF